jgi:hypothetical protein
MSNMKHFYDAQIRRNLLQVVRAFSHFEVSELDSNGNERLIRVPCRMGDPSRQVASIIAGNSENTLNTLPMITVGVQTIQADPQRRQDPTFTRTDQFAEREYDPVTGQYTTNQGDLYSVTRYMPVPYLMTVQVDIFTANLDSKFQLLEQIMVLFNPGIQLSLNSNPIDWSNISEIEMADILWSNRTIPRGTEEIVDMATITFNVKVWISPPALVKRQRIINTIIADIKLVNSVSNLGYTPEFYNFFEQLAAGERVIATPNNHRVDVKLDGADVVLGLENLDGSEGDWAALMEMYGTIDQHSRVVLNLSDNLDDDSFFVTGVISENPNDSSTLLFDLDQDSLPANTLPEVNAFVDPRTQSPGDGLPAAVAGQRYVALETIVEAPGVEWGWGISMNAGDIVQYNGVDWEVVFDSAAAQNAEWITDLADGDQWRWTGEEWIHSYRGTYHAGFWRIVI